MDILPQHIAVIPDGNGRWANALGKSRTAGHQAGAQAVNRLVDSAGQAGIKVLTIFAFSTENWLRPSREVNLLLNLFFSVIAKESKRLHEKNLKLRFIGNKEKFTNSLQRKMLDLEKLTQNNTGMVVNIAANYGGQWDITQAVSKIVEQAKVAPDSIDKITDEMIASHLTMADLPDVDLLIRTSGECRLSNFMLWQAAYAELYFLPVLWPDFSQTHFMEALSWFASRERRFGKTTDQLHPRTAN